MTYLLKDEDGEIYAAVSNVGPADIQRAQFVVDEKIKALTPDWEEDSIYQVAARELGFKGSAGGRTYDLHSKAALVRAYLIEKCGGTELDFSIWRCGL